MIVTCFIYLYITHFCFGMFILQEFTQLKLIIKTDDNSEMSQELCLAREQVQNMVIKDLRFFKVSFLLFPSTLLIVFFSIFLSFSFSSKHSELLDTRRKLLQCERKEQKFLEELEEAHGLLTGKEEDCTRLAKELGSSQVREAQAEARCVQEVRRAEQQCSLKVGNYESEVCS